MRCRILSAGQAIVQRSRFERLLRAELDGFGIAEAVGGATVCLWQRRVTRQLHPVGGFQGFALKGEDSDALRGKGRAFGSCSARPDSCRSGTASRIEKGHGFAQPVVPHEHWHIDVSYLNIGGTFYYLCSILNGYRRYIVNRDIRDSMTEADIEIILQGAKEKYPEARPRIISDKGPQFIA